MYSTITQGIYLAMISLMALLQIQPLTQAPGICKLVMKCLSPLPEVALQTCFMTLLGMLMLLLMAVLSMVYHPSSHGLLTHLVVVTLNETLHMLQTLSSPMEILIHGGQAVC